MSTHATLHLIGQVILGGFFVLAGINQVVDADRLTEWVEAKRVPYASMAVYLSGLAVIIGGGAVIASPFVAQNTRTIGAVILIAFLIVITPIMHNFWKMEESEGIYPVKATDGGQAYTLPPQPNQFGKFLQNIGLIGALLTLL